MGKRQHFADTKHSNNYSLKQKEVPLASQYIFSGAASPSQGEEGREREKQGVSHKETCTQININITLYSIKYAKCLYIYTVIYI